MISREESGRCWSCEQLSSARFAVARRISFLIPSDSTLQQSRLQECGIGLFFQVIHDNFEAVRSGGTDGVDSGA